MFKMDYESMTFKILLNIEKKYQEKKKTTNYRFFIFF